MGKPCSGLERSPTNRDTRGDVDFKVQQFGISRVWSQTRSVHGKREIPQLLWNGSNPPHFWLGMGKR